MFLTLQTHFEDEWHQAPALELKNDAAGFQDASIVDYDLDYFIRFASVDFAEGNAASDNRALSIRYPVDLENRYTPTWPPFLLDLMPQGHARRKLAGYLGLSEGARGSDLPLLLRSAASGLGNVRIKEAAEAEEQRLHGVPRSNRS